MANPLSRKKQEPEIMAMPPSPEMS